MNRFGFEETQWEAAKAEGKAVLSGYAKRGKRVAYSKFVTEIHSIQLEPHDLCLFDLLGEISTEEDIAGRGMLSSLVVHKEGDGLPGPGFFEVARELGHDTSDIVACWIYQVNKVIAAWHE